MSVCEAALERQIFTAHPINAQEKETASHIQTKTKAKEEKLKTENPKQCRNVMQVKNALLRSDFIFCFIKVSVLLFVKNESIAKINRLM